MKVQASDGPARPGIDLNAYLALHAGDMVLMLLIAAAITVGHWRYWFYPDDLMLSDGKTPSPLAGTLNLKRVVGDFLFLPTGIVCGMLVLGFGLGVGIACAVVVFVVFVGSAFLMTTFEKARDGALGVALQILTNWIPGGKK